MPSKKNCALSFLVVLALRDKHVKIVKFFIFLSKLYSGKKLCVLKKIAYTTLSLNSLVDVVDDLVGGMPLLGLREEMWL
jgi:hypothetical protein